jgi:hypothetical protein
VGGKGMYIMTTFENATQAEMMFKQVEPYR